MQLSKGDPKAGRLPEAGALGQTQVDLARTISSCWIMRCLVTSAACDSVAVFCMADRGHFQRLRPIIVGLVARGLQVHVFTSRRFAVEVRAAGGCFVDLFDGRALDAADTESWPEPVRYASFAGCFADAVIDAARAVRPQIVVRDTFAVIGQLVAHALGLPDVNVCAGHAVVPDRFLAVLAAHPRVRVSSRCGHFVEVLRRRYGLSDASPFSYVTAVSRDLNVYGEPEQFLDEADRGVFEPVAFYGSLPDLPELRSTGGGRKGLALFGSDAATRLKVYVSFGTVIWSYRTAEAVQAIAAIVRAFGARDDVRTLVSLGGASLEPETRASLDAPGVRVESYVDQWSVLQTADVFVTHHGLNSTHEAIWHGVPMISYPFVWDQPGLARRCQALGLAVPLAADVMAPVSPFQAAAALDRVSPVDAGMREAFVGAKTWERTTIDGRPGVIDRIIDLGRRRR